MSKDYESATETLVRGVADVEGDGGVVQSKIGMSWRRLNGESLSFYMIHAVSAEAGMQLSVALSDGTRASHLQPPLAGARKSEKC